jgi:cell division protein FtsB
MAAPLEVVEKGATLNLQSIKEKWLAWVRDFGAPVAGRKRRRRMALAAVALGGLYAVFGGDQGLVSLALSWRETWALKREIVELQKNNRELEARQTALAHDRDFYEKLAREKLMLKAPGELVYRFDRHF